MSGTRVLFVDVTYEDIRLGRRHNATRCPVRRALRRAGVPAHAVFHDGYEFRSEDSPLIPFPKAVGQWIRRYDAGELVYPLTFRAGVPA